MSPRKHQCACCGFYTLTMVPDGNFEICPVCIWIQDNEQEADPDLVDDGGGNGMSLNEARDNYASWGAKARHFRKFAREPNDNEL